MLHFETSLCLLVYNNAQELDHNFNNGHFNIKRGKQYF